MDLSDELAPLLAAAKRRLLHWLSECESPIEQQLLVALWEQDFFTQDVPDNMSQLAWNMGYKLAVATFYGRGERLLLVQHCVGNYRLDFAVVDLKGNLPPVAIEADGHDYHERTKEQARHDKERDRWLQAHGWVVLRFTGSEIFRDAGACADAVADQLAADDDRALNKDRGGGA